MALLAMCFNLAQEEVQNKTRFVIVDLWSLILALFDTDIYSDFDVIIEGEKG